jgi:hypothetical protein
MAHWTAVQKSRLRENGSPGEELPAPW